MELKDIIAHVKFCSEGAGKTDSDDPLTQKFAEGFRAGVDDVTKCLENMRDAGK